MGILSFDDGVGGCSLDSSTGAGVLGAAGVAFVLLTPLNAGILDIAQIIINHNIPP